ncbi:MAG: ATP-binding cassette domain-containing protein [Spirochaetales bacterium]|nr:ATP-binding cassette domain-containing protein [Spirochaetales bacterium]
MAHAIEVNGLTKEFSSKVKSQGFTASVKGLLAPRYRTIRAVQDISFCVEEGDILAFIGPNGAGKSTTIKLITGILFPTSGSISVLGMNPHTQRKHLSYHIGTVFGQKSQLWYHLPPIDSLTLLGSIYDLSKKQTKNRIEFLAGIFELETFLDQPVRKLSLGQRIRCEIAGSLIHSPKILFLDEPSIGLDVVVKQRIRDLILKINKEEKTTIFLTSHDAGDIEKICKRALVINHGALVWEGTIKDMKYSLLNRRIIDVKTDQRLCIDIPGVKTVKSKEYAAKLEVELSAVSVEEVIQEIMKRVGIKDITISNVPMEEIISMIYQGGFA